MGFKDICQSFPEFVFQFSVEQVLLGLRKQLMNNFVFPTRACAVGFNKNNNNNNVERTFLLKIHIGLLVCCLTLQ